MTSAIYILPQSMTFFTLTFSNGAAQETCKTS